MSKKRVDKLVEKASDPQIAELKGTISRLQVSLDKEKNKTEAITDALYLAIKDGLASVDLPDFTPPKKDKRTKGAETAIMVLSDFQLGKVTPTYNSATVEERVKLYCEKVAELVEIQRLDHPVKKVAIFIVGDIVEGELIFPGQAHHIDSSLYRQVTIDGPRILGGAIKWASDFFDEVEIFAVPGNHGYIGGRSRRDMHPESNADRMLYQIVLQLTENLENVKWTIAEDWYLNADLGEGDRFLLLHGQEVKGWAGIPWYGWYRRVLGWASLSRIWDDMDFKYVVAGHFHTPTRMYLNGRTIWINASTESHNPYALQELSAAGEPAQWLLFHRAGRGITAEYLVQLI